MAAKAALFTLLYRSGIARAASWGDRSGVRILCYHGVTERGERAADDPAGLHVRRDRFESQLGYLRRHHNVVALRDYVEARRAGRPLPPGSVVLTFDDGYRNALSVAAPVLGRLGVPATFFLVSDWVEQAGDPEPATAWTEDDDRSSLSWREASALASSPSVEIGSHTRSHAVLPQLSREAAREELEGSLSAVRARLGGDDVYLAYPKGHCSGWVAELARDLGYGCALTTDGGANGPDTDLFRLRRTLVGDDDDVAALAVRLSGIGFWLSGARARLAQLPRWARRRTSPAKNHASQP